MLLEIIRQDGSISTDKREVLEKWCSDFSDCFKGMKDDPDLVFDEGFLESIENLKCVFDKLSSGEQEAKSSFDSTMLNRDISYDEVSAAIDKAKLGNRSNVSFSRCTSSDVAFNRLGMDMANKTVLNKYLELTQGQR